MTLLPLLGRMMVGAAAFDGDGDDRVGPDADGLAAGTLVGADGLDNTGSGGIAAALEGVAAAALAGAALLAAFAAALAAVLAAAVATAAEFVSGLAGVVPVAAFRAAFALCALVIAVARIGLSGAAALDREDELEPVLAASIAMKPLEGAAADAACGREGPGWVISGWAIMS